MHAPLEPQGARGVGAVDGAGREQVDRRIATWRQGDCVVGDDWFLFRSEVWRCFPDFCHGLLGKPGRKFQIGGRDSCDAIFDSIVASVAKGGEKGLLLVLRVANRVLALVLFGKQTPWPVSIRLRISGALCIVGS